MNWRSAMLDVDAKEDQRVGTYNGGAIIVTLTLAVLRPTVAMIVPFAAGVPAVNSLPTSEPTFVPVNVQVGVMSGTRFLHESDP